jgi:ectoine hydroxylase-related dioxygenase (phytanoyl-CoA dioxygenase family)
MSVEEPDLSEAHEQYESEGYTTVSGVLDDDLVEAGREHIDWLRQQYPDKRPEDFGDLEHVAQDPFWLRLVSDDRLLDIAEQFLGPNVALFASHYIAKPPKDGQQVLWHQDGSYWPLEPMDVITLWVSFDRSDPESGCLRVVPDTQDIELQEVVEREDTENVLGSETNTDNVDTSNAVDLELDPGDVSIHHPNVVHGSDGNTSDRWRRGLTIRYIPTTTKILTDDQDMGWPSAFLLRGNAEPNVNEYQELPLYDPDSDYMEFDGWEEYNEYARRMNDRI